MSDTCQKKYEEFVKKQKLDGVFFPLLENYLWNCAWNAALEAADLKLWERRDEEESSTNGNLVLLEVFNEAGVLVRELMHD